MAEIAVSAGAASSSARYRVETVTSLERWQALAEEWDRLLRSTQGHTALQGFDFLSTWWACFGADRELWILAFYEASALVGIAPLQITERRILGKAYRALEFLAMTEDILRPTMLFPSADRERLLAALNDFLAEQRGSWDAIELDELACSDPLIESMRRLASSSRCLYRETPFHPCPFLDLSSQSWASYIDGRSSKLRKNLRSGARRLAESGSVDLEIYRTPADILRGFERFRELARRSWKHAAKIGIADDARYETFYARLLEIFARRQGARVLILTAEGNPVAATLAVVSDGVYYSLQIVHDEAHARCSPGTLLECRELELLFGDGGVRRYEFMGGALSNKLRWTEAAVETVCISVVQPDLRLRALELYEAAKRTAKRALRRVRSAAAALRGGTGT